MASSALWEVEADEKWMYVETSTSSSLKTAPLNNWLPEVCAGQKRIALPCAGREPVPTAAVDLGSCWEKRVRLVN